jgi:hypothetical protein
MFHWLGRVVFVAQFNGSGVEGKDGRVEVDGADVSQGGLARVGHVLELLV